MLNGGGFAPSPDLSVGKKLLFEEKVLSEDFSNDLSSFEEEEEPIEPHGVFTLVSDDASTGVSCCDDFVFAACDTSDLWLVSVSAGGFISSFLGNLILILRTSCDDFFCEKGLGEDESDVAAEKDLAAVFVVDSGTLTGESIIDLALVWKEGL